MTVTHRHRSGDELVFILGFKCLFIERGLLQSAEGGFRARVGKQLRAWGERHLARMFHNCFDGTLPKIQTSLTGQGVQGTHHCSPVLAELLPAMLDIYPPKKPCRVWGCLCCEFTFLPAGSCQKKKNGYFYLFILFLSGKLALLSPTALVCSPYNLGFCS